MMNISFSPDRNESPFTLKLYPNSKTDSSPNSNTLESANDSDSKTSYPWSSVTEGAGESSPGFIRGVFKLKRRASTTLSPPPSPPHIEEKLEEPEPVHLELYNKFKQEPLGISFPVVNYDSVGDPGGLGINFDHPSLDFDIKLPKFESSSTILSSAGTPPSSKTPTKQKSSSPFERVKQLLYRNHWSHHDMNKQSAEFSVASSEFRSPVNMRIPVKEDWKTGVGVPIDISIFQNNGFGSPISEQCVQDNKSIKFKQYVDMLVYNNKFPYSSSTSSEKIDRSCASPVSNDSYQDNSNWSNAWPKKRLRKSKSAPFKRMVPLESSYEGSENPSTRRKRSISLSLTRRTIKNISNIPETPASRPVSSILKNKINSNFDIERQNTVRDDTVNIEAFLKNFERFEMEKYEKESQLEHLRHQQIQHYYENEEFA
ncbi:predicted protein [Scheffersomyces stipitis CBS 6054]|uniref:Uncharacterized protein n=1 Tax=Scheffersomyces stipitis (strain ATCC 58785 / CBS 6054 / NBRC 10063 / NRRL Y-11545) TaxID=322104 RepID=A3LZM2_PICST|nr:predicted protein [Scheffersomyces stipitis CBS 6054]ABN68179.2 predicted protein [Scheffersomyces stipitis CBS 6054]